MSLNPVLSNTLKYQGVCEVRNFFCLLLRGLLRYCYLGESHPQLRSNALLRLLSSWLTDFLLLCVFPIEAGDAACLIQRVEPQIPQ